MLPGNEPQSKALQTSPRQ